MGSQHSLSQGWQGGGWTSHPDPEKVGEADSADQPAFLTAACPRAVTGTSADGPAHGEAEFDLLRVGHGGVNLSILIFISVIVVYGSIKKTHKQTKTTTQDTKHIWQSHTESSISVGHAGLPSNGRGHAEDHWHPSLTLPQGSSMDSTQSQP